VSSCTGWKGESVPDFVWAEIDFCRGRWDFSFGGLDFSVAGLGLGRVSGIGGDD